MIGALIASGCGLVGGAVDGDAPTSAGLEATTRAYGDALLSDSPADTYEYLAAECRETWTYDDWANQMNGRMRLVTGLADGIQLSVGEVGTRDGSETAGESFFAIDLNGVSVETDDEVIWMPWVREDGAWRTTKCSALTLGP